MNPSWDTSGDPSGHPSGDSSGDPFIDATVNAGETAGDSEDASTGERGRSVSRDEDMLDAWSARRLVASGSPS